MIKTLILLAILLAPAFGQEVLIPVRVQITATAEEEGEEVAGALQARLRGLRYLIITDKRPDWRIVLAASKDKCGYIAALVVMDARGASQLSIHTGPDLEAVTGHLTEKLEKEFLLKRK
jgi:hypothetical protein